MRILFTALMLLFFSHFSVAKTQFLTISDIHFGSQNHSGKGQDTGIKLLQVAMDKLTELSARVDFIINLGDMPTHGFYPVNEKENYEKLVFQNLTAANTSKKPIFYVTGNNDSLLGNYQPFSQDAHSPLDLAEHWEGACLYCQNLMINAEHMYDGGYYASYVTPNNKEVILIALNTIQFVDFAAQMRFPYPNQEQDAATQLHWLEQQLNSNRAKQLLIAMHIPPGVDYKGSAYWQTGYLKQFIALLQQYSTHYQQITLLTGHTHMDEIRQITLRDAANIYVFSTPGLSPVYGNNSAMKVFTLSRDYALENFTTHYTTDEEAWLNGHYFAINQENGIFPECQKQTLASCLDHFTKEQLCKKMETGHFYSVKSNVVDLKACLNIYSV